MCLDKWLFRVCVCACACVCEIKAHRHAKWMDILDVKLLNLFGQTAVLLCSRLHMASRVFPFLSQYLRLRLESIDLSLKTNNGLHQVLDLLRVDLLKSTNMTNPGLLISVGIF